MDQESTESPPAEEVPPTPGRPQQRVDRPSPARTDHVRAREQLPSFRYFSRPSSPSVSNRQRFDWHSVTAPPPPISPLSRPNSPAISSPFATSLHRPSPVHRDREPHPGFSPQVPPAGSIYPLRHPRIPHLGVDLGGGRGAGPEAGAPQVFKCSGPEKEYRRCFSQVGFTSINLRK